MRVCNNSTCGTLLKTKTGAPDYRRHWCSRECKNSDAKEKMAARRKVVHGRKCRLCGRKAIAAAPLLSGVSQDTGPRVINITVDDWTPGEDERLRSERPEEEVEVPQ